MDAAPDLSDPDAGFGGSGSPGQHALCRIALAGRIEERLHGQRAARWR